MNSYETSVTVEQQGRIVVAGLPFAPGTEVQVVIWEKVLTEAKDLGEREGESRVPMKELFARVKARNTESVGPLCREELYGRKVLR